MGWQKRAAFAALMIPLVAVLSIGLAASNGKDGHKHESSGKGDQNKHHHMGHKVDRPAPVKGDTKPIRMEMGELHEHGGVPPGWKFRFPNGEPDEGRKVFIALECYTCHKVAGAKFPKFDLKPTHKGPELTGMGAHHPVEYFLESVVNPNRVITEGPGYTGKDSLSIMPSYNHLLTVEELVNLGAYLKSLTGGGHGTMKMKKH